MKKLVLVSMFGSLLCCGGPASGVSAPVEHTPAQTAQQLAAPLKPATSAEPAKMTPVEPAKTTPVAPRHFELSIRLAGGLTLVPVTEQPLHYELTVVNPSSETAEIPVPPPFLSYFSSNVQCTRWSAKSRLPTLEIPAGGSASMTLRCEEFTGPAPTRLHPGAYELRIVPEPGRKSFQFGPVSASFSVSVKNGEPPKRARNKVSLGRLKLFAPVPRLVSTTMGHGAAPPPGTPAPSPSLSLGVAIQAKGATSGIASNAFKPATPGAKVGAARPLAVDLFARPVRILGKTRRQAARCGASNSLYPRWKARGPVFALQTHGWSSSHQLSIAAGKKTEKLTVHVGGQDLSKSIEKGAHTLLVRVTDEQGAAHWLETAATELLVVHCFPP